MRVQTLANFGFKLVAAFVLVAGCAAASAATIEVQGVGADRNSKAGVPASLARFQSILEKTQFTAFKDCGTQVVKPSGDKKDSTTIQGYCIIINTVKVEGNKARVGVLFKDRGRITHDAVELTLTAGQPTMFAQLGEKDSPCIILLTLKDTEK
jgi:hypothetical protein